MGIHDDHRQRVKARFLEDPDRLNDWQLLELFLFYSNPRSDVVPIVERLRQTFGTVDRVFSASPEELTAVKGIGEHAAISILLHSKLEQRCLLARQDRDSRITSADGAAEYLSPLFFGARAEQLRMLCLDSLGTPLRCTLLDEGSKNAAELPLLRLVREAEDAGADCVILAHNHVTGAASPSAEDLTATSAAKEVLEEAGIKLMDHLILADGEYYSFRQNELITDN